MASPHHCHQSSLEGIINFSPEHPLDTDLRDHATSRFHIICKHFDDITGMPKEEFSRPKLILYTYQYSLSQQSKDHFLRVFFHAIYLPIDDNSEDIDYPEIRPKFFDFGDYLFNNFFLPVKASTKQTPQPSPALHSAVQEAQGQGGQQHVGTTYRLSALRGECLIRDRHRCVISRRFDKDEAMKRYKTAGTALDDDGNLVANDPLQPVYLELGHILPHSLTKTNRSSKLDPSKQSALAILNMFDVNIAELIQGPDIDRPRNALTLAIDHRIDFGDFRIYFEHIPNKDHTYTIKTFLPDFVVSQPEFPITRELYLTPDRTIDPPSRRLLAVHRAIAHILHLSKAGDYIDKIFRDLERNGVQEDGSTPLDRLVALALSEQTPPFLRT